MTDDETAKTKSLCDAATAGPWRFEPHRADLGAEVLADQWANRTVCVCPGEGKPTGDLETGKGGQADRDAEFIAASRSLVPALLDEVERLSKRAAAGAGPTDQTRRDNEVLERVLQAVFRLQEALPLEAGVLSGAAQIIDYATRHICRLDAQAKRMLRQLDLTTRAVGIGKETLEVFLDASEGKSDDAALTLRLSGLQSLLDEVLAGVSAINEREDSSDG